MPAIAKIERAPSLRDQVVARLLASLREGKFVPGERLTEGNVASVLGVSRTPVREALGLLAERGILARRDGGGFIVFKPSRKSLTDMFELRRLLEPYALGRAARLVTDADIAELSRKIGILRRVIKDGSAADVAQTNRELRRLLFGFSGNVELSRAIEQVSDHVYLIGMMTMNSQATRAMVLNKHERIFKALSARSRRSAEKAVAGYLEAAFASVTGALSEKAELFAGRSAAPNAVRVRSRKKPRGRR
jgi:DNA-binding GntR family transcriptional regulator